MGGKYFLCKELSATMKRLVPPDKVSGYVEPFCGALNVLMEMNGDYKCSASDYHPDLIQLWRDIQNNTFHPPEEIDEKFYHECKELVSPNSLKAFVGFNMSFGGKFFAGYVDKYKNGSYNATNIICTRFVVCRRFTVHMFLPSVPYWQQIL